jgi:hypothetical protein
VPHLRNPPSHALTIRRPRCDGAQAHSNVAPLPPPTTLRDVTSLGRVATPPLGEQTARIGAFEASTIELGGRLAALPESVPLTMGAAISWLISPYDHATADPGTAHDPELGPQTHGWQ